MTYFTFQHCVEMEIIVGTYDELLLAYTVEEVDGVYAFEQSFTNHTHVGCIKAVDVSEKGILASGSSDENIRLFNLRSRRELGSLVHHNGTVTGLCFHNKNHMLSCSQDGTIAIWHSRRWECQRTLRGHKDAVNSLSIHPSGKLALSVGRDKTLRMWNLMTGKCAFTSNTKQEADMVRWSPSGGKYFLVYRNRIDIYDVETAEIEESISCSFGINTVKPVKDDVVLISGEGGNVEIYSITPVTKLHSFSTGTNRVKDICCYGSQEGESTDIFTITASSDGWIKLWKLSVDAENEWSSEMLGAQNTKFRLTCVTVYEGRGSAPQETASSEQSTSETVHSPEPEGGSDSGIDASSSKAASSSSQVTEKKLSHKKGKKKGGQKRTPDTDILPQEDQAEVSKAGKRRKKNDLHKQKKKKT